MMWHYAVGEKRSQSSLENLAKWIQNGQIGPDTLVWTEGMSDWLPLKNTDLAQYLPASSAATTSPKVPPTPPSPPKQVSCTNCGKTISEQAVACMSCGTKPTGHKKFCRQCGVALNPEQVVCTQCGAELTTGYANTMNNLSATENDTRSSSSMFGKPLVSGNGKGNSVIFTTWIIAIIGAIFIAVIWCGILPERIRGPKRPQFTEIAGSVAGPAGMHWNSSMLESALKSETAELEGKATAVFCCGIVFSSLLILYTAFAVNGAVKTSITVYEKGIIGIGCGKYFAVNFELHHFQLTFDKVISVDSNKTAVIIHVGTQYKCYVANPVEIQNCIVRQQQSIDQSGPPRL